MRRNSVAWFEPGYLFAYTPPPYAVVLTQGVADSAPRLSESCVEKRHFAGYACFSRTLSDTVCKNATPWPFSLAFFFVLASVPPMCNRQACKVLLADRIREGCYLIIK